MTWARGRIRTTQGGFRAVLDHSKERYTSRLYKTASGAKGIAKVVAEKMGWNIDWVA